jgi:Ca2+-transporting ATPase
MKWYQATIQQTLQAFNSSLEGLSESTVQQLQQQYGKNQLKEFNKKAAWQILFAQFTEVMILILLIAAVISFFIGDARDTIIILVIVMLNALVGFVQEYNAEKAIEHLKKLSASKAEVIREGGKVFIIPASELVPGDIILLDAGDGVPADARLVEAYGLKVDEASLTGESFSVEKNVEALDGDHTSVGDQLNMVFKSTWISSGRATAVVVATGMQTEIGKIASMLQQEEVKTPLQIKLFDFSKKLSIVIALICLIIYGAGVLRHEDHIQMLMTAISVAVAAIPEALPAVITVALALGARRMVRKKALIRKLPAVETLGSVNYICTDKTGTLTMNKMAVRKIWTPDHNFALDMPTKAALYLVMSLNQDTQQSGEEITGDSTEIAAVQYAMDMDNDLRRSVILYPRLSEIPFESERRMMTTIHRFGDQNLVITKGAIESVISKCVDSNKIEILKKADAMADEGMRTLAYACKLMPEQSAIQIPVNEIESDLHFIGLIAMIDPPRAEVIQAVKECQAAGIIPVMITGDHSKTAAAIALEVGVMKSTDRLLTGTEMAAMTFEQLCATVQSVRVYARVSAEQKLSIVKALQSHGHYVAMTGDGVNDAPSLKMANIGVAMGITGTDVSKQAADMILLDDNFATIVKAVREGRRIFDNIQKFIRYIMSGNAGEIWTILLAPLVGLPIPLLPIHILWINLVTDGLPSLALANESAELNIMQRPPRSKDKGIFSNGVALHILWVGLLMGALCLGIQAYAIHQGSDRWQTMVFTTLSFCQLAHVFAIRSFDVFIYKHGLFKNRVLLFIVIPTVILQLAIIYVPFLHSVFHTTSLTTSELLICFAAAAIVFHAVEIEKWIRHQR